MRTYRVTFQPHTGRSAEAVQADRMSIERGSGLVVQHADVQVIGQPREIIFATPAGPPRAGRAAAGALCGA